MSDKLPRTRRGIYLTNLQWADAKAAGDGIYSAGVRRRMEEWAALQAEKVELEQVVADLRDALTQVSNEARAERDELWRLQAEYKNLTHENVDLELQLAAVPTYRVRGRWFILGWLAALVAFAVALAVLEGIDKAWWGWTL